MKVWILFWLSIWGVGANPSGLETGSALYGLDFGDPTLGCQGRGRICRVEKMDATEGEIPAWVEAVGGFHDRPKGEIVFIGHLTSKGTQVEMKSGDTLSIDKEFLGQTRFARGATSIFTAERWGRKIQLTGTEEVRVPSTWDK